MKNRFLRFLVISFSYMMCLSACTAGGDSDVTLHVIAEDWSGWSGDFKPDVKDGQYVPKPGEDIFSEWGLVIRIKAVSSDGVTLVFGSEYNGKFKKGGWCIAGEDGGISLMAEDGIKEYTIKRGETLSVATQTMDAGWNVAIRCE